MTEVQEKKTMVLQARDITQDKGNIDQAGKVLKEGGLVVFPTETVYGIGANALDVKAVAGIFTAKGRPQDNPLIIHVTDVEELLPLVREIPEKARLLANAFWPGPLTMIFPRSGAVPAAVSAGLDTVAIRIPSHPIARAVIGAAGVPVAAPSANRSGSPSPTNAHHCILDLDGRVDLILDGGECQVGVESTVLSLVGEQPRLLRPGGVTVEQIQAVIGPVEVDSAVLQPLEAGERPSSPGMKYRHYAPKAEVVLVHGSLGQFDRFCRTHNEPGTFLMCFEEDLGAVSLPAVSYGSGEDPEEQAHRLFAALRQLDEKGAKKVFVRAPSSDGVGLAVYNRLLRAASFRQVSASGGYGEPKSAKNNLGDSQCQNAK